MNKEVAQKAAAAAPVYGCKRNGDPLNGVWERIMNFLFVFFYKAGFVLCVEGLSKSGVSIFLWPILNGALVYSMIEHLDIDKEKVVENYPMALTIFIQFLILFWWFNKSTSKKFILEFVGPALKDLASAFKR